MGKVVVKSASLYFREGSSDKVYKITMNEEKGKYTVDFAYGRRGNALTTGTKTATPVDHDKAMAVFGKLVKEKTDKGYKDDGSGVGFTGAIVAEPRDTGIRPQLLNEITESDVEKFIKDPDWCAQEKFDGRRRLIIKKGSSVVGTNRKGLTVAISAEMEAEMKEFGITDMCLDGEIMDEYIMVFDSLDLGNRDYAFRYSALKGLLSGCKTLRPVYTAFTTEQKRELYNRLKKENAEGIVFKNINAKYKPGRPNSGGDQLKFKFCATASCLVVKTNAVKRSIALAVYDDKGHYVQVGNCTVYPNQNIPPAGSIVEVKYLYYFAGGSLFQPVLQGTGDCTRDDIDAEDCTLKQLKVKREEEIIL